jgi:hypothetical protein
MVVRQPAGGVAHRVCLRSTRRRGAPEPRGLIRKILLVCLTRLFNRVLGFFLGGAGHVPRCTPVGLLRLPRAQMGRLCVQIAAISCKVTAAGWSPAALQPLGVLPAAAPAPATATLRPSPHACPAARPRLSTQPQ